MLLPEVFFLVTALAAVISDTTKLLPLILPILGIVTVPATIVSVVPSFLQEWALVSHVIARTTFVAFRFVFVDICKGCFVPTIIIFLLVLSSLP